MASAKTAAKKESSSSEDSSDEEEKAPAKVNLIMTNEIAEERFLYKRV